MEDAMKDTNFSQDDCQPLAGGGSLRPEQLAWLKEREAAHKADIAKLDDKAKHLATTIGVIAAAVLALSAGERALLRDGGAGTWALVTAAGLALGLALFQAGSATAARGMATRRERVIARLARVRIGWVARRAARGARPDEVGLYNPFAAAEMSPEQVLREARQGPVVQEQKLANQITWLSLSCRAKARAIGRGWALTIIAVLLVVAAALTA
jgi:hypothetical protein